MQQEIRTFGLPLTEDKLTTSDHFGEAPFFRLFRVQGKERTIIEERLLENPYLHEDKAKGIKVANWLLENDLDVLIVHHDQTGRGPGFVLDNAGAEILLTQETNVEKALVTVEEGLGYKIKRDDAALSTEILWQLEEKKMNTTPLQSEERVVRDIMTRGVSTVQCDQMLPKAAEIMTEDDISCIVVVDQNDEAAGIISSLDMVRAFVLEANID